MPTGELVKKADYNAKITKGKYLLKIKYLKLLAWVLMLLLMLLKIRYLTSVIKSRKQIMKQNCLTMGINILPHLIIINLRVKYLTQIKKKNYLISLIFPALQIKKITTLTLKTVQNKIKLRNFRHFIQVTFVENNFENDGTQNYLVFQPVLRYFKEIANSDNIPSWKSKKMSDESIKHLAASNNSFAASLNFINTKIQAELDGICLRQEKSNLLIKK